MQLSRELTQTTSSSDRVSRVTEWLTQYANKRLNSFEIRERRTIPAHVILDFGNHGLLGLQASINDGGLELNYQEMLYVITHLASIDTTLASFVGIQNALFLHPILLFKDSHSDVQRYLPKLASGRILGAFAMTEDSSGSNPQETLAEAKKVNGGFLLSARKRWIGTAAWSGLIIVFAKIKHDMSDVHFSRGMTAFLVKTESEGVNIGEEALTFGMNGMIQSDLLLDNVFVPDSMVLGRIGRGFDIASRAMMLARLAIAAAAIGAMRRGLQIAEKFSANRKMGSSILANFETMQLSLQEIAADILLLERAVNVVTKKLDQNSSVPCEVYAVLKYISAEWSWRAVDAVMQSLGARGYLESNPIVQLLADVRLFRIFEGTSETMLDFLGKRTLNSTLTPDVLQDIDQTKEENTFSLRQEFEDILLIIKNKNIPLNLQAGLTHSQLAGRLLSILIMENLLFESFKEKDNSDLFLNDLLLNRLRDHFQREKILFLNLFPKRIFDDRNNLIEKALENCPMLHQTIAHPRRDCDIC